MATQVKFLKALSKHIDKLRRERKWSFNQMALECDIDKAQAYEMCTKAMDLKASTFAKLAKGFDIPISELLDFKY